MVGSSNSNVYRTDMLYDEGLEEYQSDLNARFNSAIQESAFEVVLEDDEYVLYWYGPSGECPYTVEEIDGEYVLFFNYETSA